MLSYGNDFPIFQFHRQPLPFDANDTLTRKSGPPIVLLIKNNILLNYN
jgi:hypothetical protein